jgi:protein ImuB
LAGEQQVLVPMVAGGRLPHDAVRWVPAITADLADPSSRLTPPQGVWPGQLPAPAPATVHTTPVPLTVLDHSASPVRVGGRGQLSAAPSQVVLAAGDAEAVVAWAGPWPVEEWWWDPARARRLARFQLQLASGRLLLAGIERQRWWLYADYD